MDHAVPQGMDQGMDRGVWIVCGFGALIHTLYFDSYPYNFALRKPPYGGLYGFMVCSIIALCLAGKQGRGLLSPGMNDGCNWGLERRLAVQNLSRRTYRLPQNKKTMVPELPSSKLT